MRRAPFTEDEARRLAVLHSLGILDTKSEERFDEITREAQRQLHTPIALITLVDEHRQWFKSFQGINVRETPRDFAVCAHAIHSNQVFIVPDTQTDIRFHDNPLVTGYPEIRSYAGYPIQARTGELLGTLCVIDHVPRPADSLNIERLISLSGRATDEVATGVPPSLDPDTQLRNRASFISEAESILGASLTESGHAWTLLMLHHTFSGESDGTTPRQISAQSAVACASSLRKTYGASGLYGRIGPNTFAALVLDEQGVIFNGGTTPLLSTYERSAEYENKYWSVNAGLVHILHGEQNNVAELLVAGSAEVRLAAKLRSASETSPQTQDDTDLLNSLLRMSQTLGALFPFVKWDVESTVSLPGSLPVGSHRYKQTTLSLAPEVVHWYLNSPTSVRAEIVERIQLIADGFVLDEVDGDLITLDDIKDILQSNIDAEG